MKILGIGESVIDIVQIIQNNHQQNLRSDNALTSTHVGGPVLSALILLSRLGIDCTFLTSLGRDDEAELIRQKLAVEQIRLVENLQAKTKINTIFVDAQSGKREKVRGKTVHAPIQNIPAEFIQLFDFIIIDRHEQQGFYEIVRKKRPATKMVIDPSTEVSDFTLDMIKHAEFPILPIESLVKIGRGQDLNSCLKLLHDICHKPFTITAGELGSFIFNGQRLEVVPALKIKAVDTTGAGDVYRGAFVFGLVQKWDLNQCAKFANSVAALQCTKLGNATAIPTKQEIEAFVNPMTQGRLISSAKINNYFLELHQPI